MWRKITNASVLGMVVLLLLAGVSAIFAQDTETTPTDVPTATATATATLAPTATMMPTATAVPTETAIPTATPSEEPPDVAGLGQDPTPTESTEEPISIGGITPTTFTQGTGGTLTISGANFANSTTVSLNGTLALVVTSQSESTLTAIVGTDVVAGNYTVVVSDPSGGTQTASSLLTVVAPTPVPTVEVLQLSVTQTEPAQITTGESANLSVLGANFSSSTTIRLVGFGFLNVTYINSGALTATLPTNIPAGVYSIEVADLTYGTAIAPGYLTVQAAATSATATPTATATPIPGQPHLVVNTFTASPSSIYPGTTTLLIIEVLNAGSRTAEGVVISLDDADFSPANGQASVSLPDMASSTSYVTSLAVTANEDIAEGPQSIGLVLTSRDFSGSTYTDNASVSVNVLATLTGEPQIVLDSYVAEPSAALPGDTVTVRAIFTNTGTETAQQVLVQLDGTGSDILIAGPDGSAFSLGDMPAGSSAAVVMTFVVASDAGAGAQAQSFTISYLQDGEAKQTTASISLTVETSTTETPLLLLQSYSTGQDDALQPGEQFSFAATIQNAGTVDVHNLLLTFGTVSSSNSSSSSDSTSTSSSSTSSTTISPSDNFAIYGSGGTVLLGDLAAGNNVSLSQDFIVSSALTSGIESLPITLEYQDADGAEIRQSLSASLLVVTAPRMRITATNTLDDPLTAGEEYSLTLSIANLGDSDVFLTDMQVTGDNVEISDGATVTLDPLQSDDDMTQTVTFTPQTEGSYTITVELHYIDDLNRTQTLAQTFSGQVEAAAETSRQPMRMPPTQEQTTEDTSTQVGRLLLGFLGFGG